MFIFQFKKTISLFLILFFTFLAIAQEKGVIIRAPQINTDYVEISDEELEAEIIRESDEVLTLRKEIEEKEVKIEQTNEEIESITRELNDIFKKKDTLEKELEKATLINKINEANLRNTQNTIYKGQLNLKTLNSSISKNVDNLDQLREILKKSYRRVNEFELKGNEDILFIDNSFFDVLKRIEETGRYSVSLHKQLTYLTDETNRLYRNREETIRERYTLEQKNKELVDRKKIYELSIAEKEVLFSQTKNSESEYQQLLKQKQREQLELQQEIYEYESEIDFIKDPNSVPTPRPGVLKLPFSSPVRISQYFGETSFARANALRYGRPFHDGVDFAINSGTQILASADGIVIGTGNTDLVRSCQSWGKWVVVRHNFGLTTLYAHLSLVKVQNGQKVKSGELLGYSGNTGFSTGPHLHFGVYDSNGVKIIPYEQVSQSFRCRGLLVPVAAQDAKLNPFQYLPNNF